VWVATVITGVLLLVALLLLGIGLRLFRRCIIISSYLSQFAIGGGQDPSLFIRFVVRLDLYDLNNLYRVSICIYLTLPISLSLSLSLFTKLGGTYGQKDCLSVKFLFICWIIKVSECF